VGVARRVNALEAHQAANPARCAECWDRPSVVVIYADPDERWGVHGEELTRPADPTPCVGCGWEPIRIEVQYSAEAIEA
jgi:NAD-dependent dihydropyrimidine dehydrogenase PreA subunit